MATNNDGIFHRRVKNDENKPSKVTEVEPVPPQTPSSNGVEAEFPESKLQAGTYWLTRIVFLRSLAFVYCKFMHHYHSIYCAI